MIMNTKSFLKDRDLPFRFRAPADCAEKLSDGAWIRYPHLDYISDRIAEIRERKLRLIVSVPPGHGKSELISHWTPVWFLGEWPDRRVGFATYEANFAGYWGGLVRDSIDMNSDILQLELTRDTTAKSDWRLRSGGSMITAGVSGPITGRRFHLLLIDDPIKNIAEAESITYRENLWKWYRTVARTRLFQDGSIIIIMTRWHDDDLIGRLQEQSGEPWEHIRLPAISEEDDKLGREVGDPLCPEMFDLPELKTLQEEVGGTTGRYWVALYQQRPSKEEGTTFKVEWWKYFEEVPKLARTAQYWDTAFKKGKNTDWSTCLTMGRHETGVVILDLWRGKVEYPELLTMVKAKYHQYNPNAVKVEDAASGQSVIQSLTRDTSIPIIKITAQGSKEQRANLITGIVEAGRVALPEKAPWLAVFLDEVTRFPGGKNDDIVDVLSYGVDDLWKKTGIVDQEVKGTDKREMEFKGIRTKEF
jgi:predicted phage terminase large subunit-like protein